MPTAATKLDRLQKKVYETANFWSVNWLQFKKYGVSALSLSLRCFPHKSSSRSVLIKSAIYGRRRVGVSYLQF
jgi:hypothetical protein